MTAAPWPGDLREHQAEIVELHPAELAPAPGVDLAAAPPAGWVGRWADRQVLERTLAEWRRTLPWYRRAVWRFLAWCATHPHLIIWRVAPPTLRGLVELCASLRAWQQRTTKRVELAAVEDRKAAEQMWEKRYAASVQRRFWVLLAGLLVSGVGGLVLYLREGWYPLALIGAVVLLGAYLVGSRARPVEADPLAPPPMPILIDDPNVPMSQLQEQILLTFEREGFPPGGVGVASPLVFEPQRLEYRMTLSSLDEITAKHLRAVERGLGAEEMTARLLKTGTATNRVLVIRKGDPYTDVPLPSWVETGSRSITEPADLGMSVGDTPFAVKFAGLHAVVVGRTGSGKTKGALWAIIDRLSACRDVVLWGVDLMNGPHLARWEGVLQRTAYTPEDAADLLEDARRIILERGQVLKAHDDADEWHSGLGPALVIVIDEYAITAQYNGTGKTLNLLGDVETIIRMGRKVWVTVILGTQKAGNSDLGSTLVAGQVSIKMLLACRERDTVDLLGTELRDRGWAPHFLTPADDEADAVNDAGKLYLETPRHRTPDVYRVWTPLTGRQVRERVQRRLADGLPRLDGGTTADAVEVPEALAFLEQRFADAGNPDELPSAAVVSGTGWTQTSVADGVRPFGITTKKVGPRDQRVNGYRLAEVRRALRDLS